jgi:Conserved TM helix
VFMLIPITIAALNALQIEAISVPAVAMLQQILSAIPKIFTASIILVVFYIIGRYVADFVTSILTSLGFDSVFGALGLPNLSAANRNDGEYTNGSLPSRTPSELVGIVIWIGIMLFAVVAAVEKLEFEILSVILSGMMLILGRILAGAIVFAIGLYLANLAYRLIASSGTGNSVFLAQATRVSILVFVAAMALQQMGIAPDIVNLAFGLLLGAIAVAIALSFGLGGRDIAAEQIREMLASFKSKSSGKSDGRPVSRSNADR